jgi:hypothetical protein
VTPDELAAAGWALFGDRWQASLARGLHISDRTVRRWVAGDSPIPEQTRRKLWSVLMERFDRMWEMQYELNFSERTVFHYPTGACFQWDDTYVLSQLTGGLAAVGEMPIIKMGAEAKLQREHKRNRRSKFTWVDPNGRPGEGDTLHGFLRGSVSIPPEIDLTEPTLDEPLDADQGQLHR